MNDNFEHQLKNVLLADARQVSEPLPGHEERFEMRLLRQREQVKVRRLPGWPMITLAAASIVGIIITIVVLETKKTNDIAATARLSDVSTEMAAVEHYYNERLQHEYSDVNSADENVQRFMQDVKRLEEEYKRLEAALSKNFNNEHIAEAMVNNYKYRLRIMEQLQKYIEIQNDLNTNNHEKISS